MDPCKEERDVRRELSVEEGRNAPKRKIEEILHNTLQ